MNYFIYRVAKSLRRLGVNFHEERNPHVRAMREEIARIGGSIQFRIDVFPDGTWMAESKNIDGIITGGTNKDSITTEIKDAVFTYFEIPPHLCNDALIRPQDEPMRLEQRVYA